MLAPVTLAAPLSMDLDAVHDMLLSDLACHPGPQGRLERTYVDTFDWRFRKAGQVVEHERYVGGEESPADPAYLRLRLRGEVVPIVESPLLVIPRLVQHVPDERLRGALVETAGGRALLVIGRLDVSARIYRQLDEAGKTVVRMVLIEATPALVAWSGSDGSARWVVLTPVRGYDAQFERALAKLSARLSTEGLEAADFAAEAAGYVPGVNPTNWRIELAVDVSSDEAIRAMLARYLQIAMANEPGVRDDLDAEFLRDFRIATRRARSLVGTAREFMVESDREWLTEELRWLGNLAGAARDLDLSLADLSAVDPANGAWVEHLGAARAMVGAMRDRARSELVEALDSPRYRALLAQAQRMSETPHPNSPAAIDLVGSRLRSTYTRLLRDGRSAKAPEEWHELRKTTKRLRYLIEGFRSLLPPETARPARSRLRSLQDVLGEYQDLCVNAEFGMHVANELAAVQGGMIDGVAVTPHSLVAAGAYAQFQAEQAKALKKQCKAAFRRFDDTDTDALFRELAWESDTGHPVPASVAE